MPLITVQDIVDLHGGDYVQKLSDRNRTGQIDVGLLELEIENAEQELMTGLYDRVAVGDSVPSFVKRHIIAIVVHNLSSMSTTAMSKNKVYLYEKAMKWRQSVVDGMAKIQPGDRVESVHADPVGDITEPAMSRTKLIEGL